MNKQELLDKLMFVTQNGSISYDKERANIERKNKTGFWSKVYDGEDFKVWRNGDEHYMITELENGITRERIYQAKPFVQLNLGL